MDEETVRRSWKHCGKCGRRGWMQRHCRQCVEDKRNELMALDPKEDFGRRRKKCKVKWCQWETRASEKYCDAHRDNPERCDGGKYLGRRDFMDSVGVDARLLDAWDRLGKIETVRNRHGVKRYAVEPWMDEEARFIASCLTCEEDDDVFDD